jgi:hypothetical protein
MSPANKIFKLFKSGPLHLSEVPFTRDNRRFDSFIPWKRMSESVRAGHVSAPAIAALLCRIRSE